MQKYYLILELLGLWLTATKLYFIYIVADYKAIIVWWSQIEDSFSYQSKNKVLYYLDLIYRI